MGKLVGIFIAMLFASVASANGALAIDSNQGDQYGFSLTMEACSRPSPGR
jgi:hypothetical protein